MLQLAEQGHELDLNVGHAYCVIGPQKGAHLKEVGGTKALLGQHPFERDAVSAEAGELVRDRDVLRRTILHWSCDMVFQAATDARQMSDDWNRQSAQVVRIADSGQHEDLRRIDRPGSKHDVLAHLYGKLALTQSDFDLHGPATLKYHPGDAGTGCNVQIGTRRCRM